MGVLPSLGSVSRIEYVLQLPFPWKIMFEIATKISIPSKMKNCDSFPLIWICGWKSWTLWWEDFSSYQIKNNRCTCFRTWRLCFQWRWIGWTPSRYWSARYLKRAPWMLVWESEHFLYIIINSFYKKMMFIDVALYSCCDLITLILWLWQDFKFPQTLRSGKYKNTKMKNRWWFWDIEGWEQKQELGNLTKAPGPPLLGAYHHPIHTVTIVWDALCRKLKSKRNRSWYWRVWREYTTVFCVIFLEECVSFPVCWLFTQRLWQFLPCPCLLVGKP